MVDSTNQILNTLHLSSGNIRIKIDFPFKKISDSPFVVAGYASIDQIDKQSEKIPVDVLKEAWNRCYKNGQVRTHLMHTNIPVGDIIPEFTEKDGTVHKTGVDGVGLYIVSTVWDNTKKAQETRDLIERRVLRGYSIGGEALGDKITVHGGEIPYDELTRIDLHEISYVDNPANPDSVFRILKRDDGEEVNIKYPDIIQVSKELILKPIPKPKAEEEQDKYVSRCVSALADADPKMDNKQRVAICYSTYRESKKNEHSLFSDLLMIPDLPEDIAKGESHLSDRYDIFLVRREEKKNLGLQEGAVQSDELVHTGMEKVDSAPSQSNKESEKVKIKVKVKLSGDN